MEKLKEAEILKLLRSMAISLKGIKESLEIISENMQEEELDDEDLDEEFEETEEVEEDGNTGSES